MNLRVSTGCYILSIYFIFFTGGFNQTKDSPSRVSDIDGNIDLPKSNPKILHRNTRSEGLEFYIHFHLYTNKNIHLSDRLVINDLGSVKRSHFDKWRPTVFVTHGELNTFEWESVTSTIRRVYLIGESPLNVIEVIWSPVKKAQPREDSETAMAIGTSIAGMMDHLKRNAGLKPELTTLIGHSLGAHIMGVAASLLISGPINQIFGLDPSRVSGHRYAEGRLTRHSARNVQVIHTNGIGFGSLEPFGHADFYANGGSTQPGCEDNNTLLQHFCSSQRAVSYFRESLIFKKSFVAQKCNSKEEAYTNRCRGERKIMGGRSHQIEVAGLYYLPTTNSSPYAIGASRK